MPTLPITLTTRDYDFVTPLATGDVVADGLDLTLLRLARATTGETPREGRDVRSGWAGARR